MKKETIKQSMVTVLIAAWIILFGFAIGCLARQGRDRWARTTEPTET